MNPSEDWLKIWNEKRDLTLAPNDLDIYFTDKVINDIKVDQVDFGNISLPSGKLIVNDPLGQYLELDNHPYFIETPKGNFPVTASIITYEDDGDTENLIACVKISFSKEKPSRYEEALKGIESIEDLKEGEFFGFASESGLATIVDFEAKNAFVKVIDEVESKDLNLYDDYFAPLFKDNLNKNPKYQSEDGDWINWKIPNTEFNVPIFQAGFGEGVYPSYFGYNDKNEIVAFYIQFIDAELEDDLEDDEWV